MHAGAECCWLGRRLFHARLAAQCGKEDNYTTIHKFPFILSSIGTENKDKQFAIIIDEAHSSQTRSLFAKMNMAVSGNVCDDEEDIEDKINKLIEGHRMVRNANYYAFTATPKNKTLEMFGDVWRCDTAV